MFAVVGNGLFGGKFDMCTDPDVVHLGGIGGGGGGSKGGSASVITDKSNCVGAFLHAQQQGGWVQGSPPVGVSGGRGGGGGGGSDSTVQALVAARLSSGSCV